MAKRRGDNRTEDLLDWRPPIVASEFAEPDRVNVRDTADRIARAVSETLRESDLDRDTIAAAMSEITGETVSKAVLDAYASVAKGSHRISLERALALVEATGNPNLLAHELKRLGWAVIPVRFVAAAEDAILDDQIHTLKLRQRAKRRTWKGWQ